MVFCSLSQCWSLPLDTGLGMYDRKTDSLWAQVLAEAVVGEMRGTKAFLLAHDAELDVVRMFRILEDGQKERVNPVSGFWFSWAAAYPDTALYK